jgi:Domain of unknown function (DUF397)
MTLPTDQPKWTRSSSCTSATCVEVADVAGRVLIRSSTRPDAATLSFSRDEWEAFTDAVKRDEFRFE